MEQNIGPYKLIGSREVYKNSWIQVREDQIVRPGGKEGIFGVVTMVPGSTIVPIDDEGNIYLIEEFKYAVGSITLEVISGAIDSGETSLQAAQRELHEEIGAIAHEWIGLGRVDPFTTVIDSPNHMFLARGLSFDTPVFEDGETITCTKMDFKKALALVLEGKISHAASCVAILKTARILDL